MVMTAWPDDVSSVADRESSVDDVASRCKVRSGSMMELPIATPAQDLHVSICTTAEACSSQLKSKGNSACCLVNLFTYGFKSWR